MSETPRITAPAEAAARPAPTDSRGRRLVEVQLVRAQEGAPVRIEAFPGERYEIRDPATGRAPKVLRAWRVGRDLWIALDTQAPADASVARPDVVIGQYFDPAFVPHPDDTLVGLDEGGATRPYQIQLETLQGAAAHRVLSTLGVVSTELVSFGPEIAAAVPAYAWGAPLLGLLAAGGGGGGGSSGGGGGGGGGTPILGAPTLSGAELAGGLNRAEAADGTTLTVRLPAGAAVGDVVTTTLTRPDGGTFTLTSTLSAADITAGEISQAVSASALTQADGAWSVRSALSRGAVAGTAASLSFTVDTVAPGAPTVSVPEGAGGLSAAEATDGTTAVVRLPAGAIAGDRLDLSFTPPGGAAVARTVTLSAADITAGQVSVSLGASDLRPGGAAYADGTWNVRATLTDAAGNGGEAGTTSFTLETRLILQGSVAAGLVTAGATVQVLGSSGELLGTAQVQGDGTWQLPLSGLGGYRGAVIVKVLDANGADANYLDEVSAAGRSLDTTLRAMSWAGDGNPLFRVSADGAAILEVSVTPLTELATRKAIGFADRPPSDFATIDQINRAVARAFGLDGELTGTPVPTNSAAFNAADGLSPAEAMGLALAKLSGLDRLNGGRLADTLAQLEQAFTGSGASLTLSAAGAALVDQGRQQALAALKAAPASAEQTFLVDSPLNRQSLGEVVVTRQDVTEDGRLIVFGQALPGSRVQIRLPDGTVQATTAAADGSFVLTSAQPQPTFVVPLAVTGQDALQQPAAHTVPSSPTIDPGNGRVISGTGTPGSQVEVFDAAGKSLGRSTVNDLGLWSLPLQAPLAADASLRAVATDANGNVSSASRASVRIDQPGLSIPEAADGYVNAAERDDNGVAVVLSLPRNAQAGSRAELLLTRPDGSTIVQRSTLTAADIEAGSVTMNLPAASLAGNGRYAVSATVSTAGGTTSPAAASSFVVDANAPAAPVVAAASDRAVQGSAEPGSTVVVRDAAGAVVGSAGPVGADGNWTVLPRVPLADGASISATATDAAGNVSPVGSGRVQAGLVQITGGIDDAAPGLGLLADGAATNDSSPLLTGSTGRVLQADQVLALYRQTASGSWVRLGAASVSGTSWTFQDGTGAAGSATAPLAAGSYAYQARIETAAGPVSGLAPSAEYDLTVVSGPPGAHQTTVTEARGNDTFINAAERLSGGGTPTVTTLPAGARAGDTLTATLRQPDGALRTLTTTLGAADVTAGSVTQLLPQEVLDLDGAYELRTTLISAVTGLANTEVVNRFTLDTTAPPSPTGGLDAGSDSGVAGDLLTNVTRPVLRGQAEAGSTVQVSVRQQSGQLAVYTLVASAQGVWSVDTGSVKPDGSAQLMAALADGSRGVSVVARDAAGNTSEAGEFTLGIDTTVGPPVIAPTNGAVAVSGSGEPGALVTLTQGASTLGSARVGADGSWRIVLLAPLADGTVLGAVQLDAAGNASAADSETVNARVPTLDPTNGRSLSGTGKAGDTIVLSAGGVAVGTALVDAEGKWQLALGTPLANGTVVQATDQQNGLSDTRAVDAVAPAAPAAQLDAASDSGLKGDGRTSDTTPVIAGTGAAAGDTITVTMPDSGEVLRTKVAADGSWRVTPANALAHGASGDVLVTATDAAGNTSAATKVALVIDTQCATPTVALDAASDSGAAGDRLTNVARPVLRGTAEPGSTVQVVVALDASGSATFTVRADALSGAWSVDTASVRPDGRTLPMPALADGSHAVSVTATDLAGNASAAAGTLALVVDTSVLAPTIAATNGLGAITGTGEAGAVVTLRGSSAALGSAVVAADGSWRIALGAALDDGARLSASQVDAAGNTSALASQTVNANVPLIEPTNGRLISGTARAGNTVVLTAAGGTTLGSVVAGADGRWSLTPASAPAHGTQLTATNQQSGLSSSQTVDAVAPGAPDARLDAASDSGVLGDGRTNVATPTLSGAGATAGDLITVTMPVSGEVLTTRVSASGAWSVKPVTALASGSSGDALVTATDPAGNTSPATRVPLAIDTTAPPSPTGGLDAGSDSGVAGDLLTNVTRPVLRGQAEAGSTVQVSVRQQSGQLAVYTLVASAQGVWSVDTGSVKPDGSAQLMAALADGSRGVSVVARDAAGNTSEAGEFTLGIDTTVGPPVIAPTNGAVAVSGSGEPGALVTLTQGASTLGSARVGADGSWRIVLLAPLADGTVLGAVQLDAAGNASAADSETVNARVPTLDPTNGRSLSGTGKAGDTIVLSAGGVAVGTALVDAEGKWQLALGTPLANGTVVQATDQQNGLSDTRAVDAVAPAAPAAQLDAASDSGLKGDGRTSDTTPVIAGTGAAAGDTITVTMPDSGEVLRTKVAADGSWRVTPANALAHGASGDVLVTATDAAGNTSAATKVALVIDTQCATPTVALDAASDSGAAGDRLTNVARPVLRGTAEPGSTVQVVVALDASGSATFTVRADALSGAWSVDTASVRPDGRTLPMPALADGSHAVSVTATDLAGNASAAAGTLALVVDTSVLAPTIAATNGLGAITGTGEAGAVVTLRGSSAALGSAVVAADGSWRIALGAALDDGARLSASQVDAAGNTSALASQTVNANVPLIEPTNGRLISGTARAGNTVVLTAAGGTTLGSVVAGADGRWSLTPASAPAHGTQLTATNQQSGLSSSQTVDAVAPGAPDARLDAASDSGVLGDGRTNVATPTLSGAGATAGDLITVTMPVSGEVLTTRVSASGAWSVKPVTALASGSSGDALVTATDPAGNTSPATRVPLAIDTTAPPSPTGGLDAGSDTGVLGDRKTRNTSPVLSGAAEAGSQVEVTLAGRTYATTATAAGRWSVAIPGSEALPDAVYRPVARVTDSAGNSTQATINDFEVDATAPAAAVTTLDPASDTGRPGDTITRDTQPTIRGSSEAGATVVFTLNGKAYRPVPDASGSWTVKVAAADALVDASYTPQVSVTDAAGNTTLAAGGRFTIDTTAPVSPRGGLDARSDTGVLGDNRTSERTPTISGTAEPGSIMEITVIGAGRTIVVATTADANGAWGVGVGGSEPLANGAYTIGLKSTDGAGNNSTGVGTPFEVFGVILARPVISQVDDDVDVTGRVEEGASTDDATPTLRISGSSGSAVKVYDGTVLLGTAAETSTGLFTFTPAAALADGLHTFSARATDSAGNVSEASAAYRVLVDTSAPATPAILVNEASTVSGTATLAAGETLSLRVGGATYAVTPAGNTWSLDLLTATPASGSLNLAEAPFFVRAEALDSAGNVSVAMRGTTRDDVITLLADDIQRLTAGKQTVQGADGLDTLAVASASEPLDLTAIADSAIQGVERINLGRNTLKLAAADVRALGGTELTVLGQSGGAVKLQGTGWANTGDVVDAGITYTVYQADGVSVRVQSGLDVTTNVSPLVLDLDSGGLQTLAWSGTRHFDLNADGRAEAVAWIAPGEAFLALDRDGDGAITSGRELFGNATPGPDGTPAAHGFEALAALDSNRDGSIDAADEAWGALRLWRDTNGDARSQPEELLRLQDAGVLRIDLAQSDALPFWQHGNLVAEQGRFLRHDGSAALVADVWLEAALPVLKLEHVLESAAPAGAAAPATPATRAEPAEPTEPAAPQPSPPGVLTLEQLLGPGAAGAANAPAAPAPGLAPGWPGPRPLPWDDLLVLHHPGG
ncbi:MAG: Ig-like domain-containing protein [Rubrivivax sp.]